MDFFSILTLVGGLAMFLYGMQVMGDGLEKLSGGKLEKILENLSSNRVKAVSVSYTHLQRNKRRGAYSGALLYCFRRCKQCPDFRKSAALHPGHFYGCLVWWNYQYKLPLRG